MCDVIHEAVSGTVRITYLTFIHLGQGSGLHQLMGGYSSGYFRADESDAPCGSVFSSPVKIHWKGLKMYSDYDLLMTGFAKQNNTIQYNTHAPDRPHVVPLGKTLNQHYL